VVLCGITQIQAAVQLRRGGRSYPPLLRWSSRLISVQSPQHTYTKFRHAIHLYSTRSSIFASSDLLLDDLCTHDILLSSVLSIGLGSTHPSPGKDHSRRQVRQRREEGSGSNPCVLLQYHAINQSSGSNVMVKIGPTP
jgi:hypothetical protein